MFYKTKNFTRALRQFFENRWNETKVSRIKYRDKVSETCGSLSVECYWLN